MKPCRRFAAALPEALEKLICRTPDMHDIEKMTKEAGFAEFTKIRDDTPLLGDA